MKTERLTVAKLKETGKVYDRFISEWEFFGKAFRAGKKFIEEVLTPHERESKENYTTRVKEAFNFPYCNNIVSIYNYFLTEKKVMREVQPELEEQPEWQDFQKNCDLYGTNMDEFIGEAQKLSGAYGTAGILVDMPPGKHEKGSGVYAYLSSYTPNNILKWTFERDFKTRRPRLTYLKLRESDQVYLVWTPEYWQRYQLDDDLNRIEAFECGDNRLGEIPFVFLPNIKDSRYFYLGVSDIADAAYVNAAIVRALSMGNEIMKLAGFPMLLYPLESENAFLEENNSDSDEVVVGEDAVLPFDPDAKHPHPKWLESPVEPSINALLAWLDRLTEEMYRACNLAGLHQNRDKAQTKSTTYLRYQFQQTNAVLSKKAEAMMEAELMIYYFWGKWQGIDNILELVTVSRIKEFSIDAMQVELENMIKSMEAVLSKHFKNKMQRRIAKHAFPDLTQDDLNKMKDEIKEELAEDNNSLKEAA